MDKYLNEYCGTSPNGQKTTARCYSTVSLVARYKNVKPIPLTDAGASRSSKVPKQEDKTVSVDF
jgi:hypothetical protein